ncbi:hypothetical protein D3C85_1192420 [compost metagenome]
MIPTTDPIISILACKTPAVITTSEITLSQLVGLFTSQILYSTLYVPVGVPASTFTLPSAFSVSPLGTATGLRITSPGFVPMTTGLPFKVSFDTNEVVVPPIVPFIGEVVSFTASISGAITEIVTAAVAQFVVFNSHT